MSFGIRVDGEDRSARAFSAPRYIDFPPPFGARLSYLFPFSDQVLYPRTMGARTALTRLAIEPAWLARLLAMLVGTGVSRLMAIEAVRHAIASRRKDRPSSKSARFALRVDVGYGGRSKSVTLVGQEQADAAAAGAAGVARLLIEDKVEPGAWMPEQIADPGPYLSRLANRGLRVEFPDGPSGGVLGGKTPPSIVTEQGVQQP